MHFPPPPPQGAIALAITCVQSVLFPLVLISFNGVISFDQHVSVLSTYFILCLRLELLQESC